MKALSASLCGGLLAASLAIAATMEDPPVFLLKWGGPAGSAPGQFEQPLGVATDADGNVYVADQFNDRIQVFTGDGQFIRQIGSNGGGPGQLLSPAGIAVSVAGLVYVTELSHNRVSVFTRDGTFVTLWGAGNRPAGIAVDPSGDVYVADTWNGRVLKFTSTGQFILSWGPFDTPIGIAADSQGNIHVADHGNSRIQKFTSNGVYLAEWATGCEYVATDADGNVYVTLGGYLVRKFSSSGQLLTEWGSWGTGDGQFRYPTGIAVDTAGHIFVAETGPSLGSIQRVQKFGQVSTATAPTTWGSLKARFR